MQLTRLGGCVDIGKCDFSGKLIYPTRRDARLALSKLRVRRAGHKTERNAYPCPFCKGWHVTCQAEKPGIPPPRLTPHKRWRKGRRHHDEEE